MQKLNKELIIIKYGTSVLVNKNVNNDISIDYNNINNHGLVIDKIKEPVIIVSSGAVAFGKSLNNNFKYIKNKIIQKRVFSALGNPYLSINWNKAISNKYILQSLLTHRDLTSKASKEKILEIIYSVFKTQKENVIIQVNDNDFITDEELYELRHGNFGDNDEITKLLTILCSNIFKKIKIIINTSADGVIENQKTIKRININKLNNLYIKNICGKNKTNLGTGGMANKLKIFKELIKKTNNTKLYIINGKKPEQLKKILKGDYAGTEIYKK